MVANPPSFSKVAQLFTIMKTSLVLFLAIACISSISYAADEKTVFDTVAVKVLDKPLPEGDNTEYLMGVFANNPDERKLAAYSTENWRENFWTFARALVNKARDQKLDSISLRKALDLILKDSDDKIAYLPVGAFQTTKNGEPVWIVTIKWEYAPRVMGEKPRISELGHVRAFAFDQKTLKQVGYMTCG